MKVLVVEDNPRLSERLTTQLRRWSVVESAANGHEALAQIAEHEFDLVILDLGLPDMSGLEVCKRMRGMNYDFPILILTGVDDTMSKVELLQAGADDYMTKPFQPEELRARVAALERRRARGPLEPDITVGDIIISVADRTVKRAGVTIKLRKKEYEILEYLARNQGRVMTRQMILDHVWPSTSSSWPGSVDVHIKQLRDKVDKPFQYSLVKTVYGVGYMVDATRDTKMIRKDYYD